MGTFFLDFVSILAAGPTSVRGLHVPSLTLDEVDEIEPDIRDSAIEKYCRYQRSVDSRPVSSEKSGDQLNSLRALPASRYWSRIS